MPGRGSVVVTPRGQSGAVGAGEAGPGRGAEVRTGGGGGAAEGRHGGQAGNRCAEAELATVASGGEGRRRRTGRTGCGSGRRPGHRCRRSRSGAGRAPGAVRNGPSGVTAEAGAEHRGAAVRIGGRRGWL
ncbi:hypothetical protein GCM10010211_26900 [Streptomyces albospinus]|uniref:Uncharacterized protein n=1 Tax=Streptomyces albospinus TaxID=285515 RepID=A0ABQ2UYT9_9ACTN|nr:hypothetical protein GCM10010211_26900 [Streptomyces albospinus]